MSDWRSRCRRAGKVWLAGSSLERAASWLCLVLRSAHMPPLWASLSRTGREQDPHQPFQPNSFAPASTPRAILLLLFMLSVQRRWVFRKCGESGIGPLPRSLCLPDRWCAQHRASVAQTRRTGMVHQDRRPSQPCLPTYREAHVVNASALCPGCTSCSILQYRLTTFHVWIPRVSLCSALGCGCALHSRQSPRSPWNKC